MPDQPITRIQKHGIDFLSTVIDGRTYVAPLGSSPPDEAPAGLWIEYTEPVADRLEVGRIELDERRAQGLDTAT